MSIVENFITILSLSDVKNMANTLSIQFPPKISKKDLIELIVKNRTPIDIENSINTELLLKLVAHHGLTESHEWKDFLNLALVNKKASKAVKELIPQKVKEMKLIENFLSSFDPSLEYPCSPKIKSKGFTKLMYLIINEKKIKYNFHSFLSSYIKQHSNELNAQNNQGWTVLMIASRNSNTTSSLETVRLLLEAGADVNAKNNDGWTALMMASRYSNTDSSLETVRLLLEAGANVNAKKDDERTALMMASRYSNTDSSLETVKLLLEAGANVNAKENDGWTALMMASGYSNTDSSLETVRLLLEAGADVNAKNDDGETALMIASRYSNTTSSLQTILFAAGAKK